MALKCWKIARAIVAVVFGIGFVLLPGTPAGIYGMDFNPAATFMARLYGAASIFEASVLWMARNISSHDVACHGIMPGAGASN